MLTRLDQFCQFTMQLILDIVLLIQSHLINLTRLLNRGHENDETKGSKSYGH